MKQPTAIECIGHTPLMAIPHFCEQEEALASVLVKLEKSNPFGSVKDRAALYIIRELEKAGRLAPGGCIVEPTSGNTGVGLAAIGACRGYRVVLTMPASMSQERRMLLAALGAELVLTPAEAGMQGAIDKADELVKAIPGAVLAGQFVNPANVKAHYETTGPELWQQTDGRVDCFAAGVGTGGTITGTGRYLKEQNPRVHILAVEPSDSPVLSGGQAGPHPLQGIGAGFVPEILDVSLLDEIAQVTGEQAKQTARALAKTEGIMAGISGGAALYAGLQWAKRPENEGKTCVVLLPDGGEKYFSTDLFAL